MQNNYSQIQTKRSAQVFLIEHSLQSDVPTETSAAGVYRRTLGASQELNLMQMSKFNYYLCSFAFGLTHVKLDVSP